MAYIAGFIVGWWFIRWMAKTGRSPLTIQQSGDLIFSSVLGVLFGGRIGFALFYDPSLFVEFSESFPWWDLLAINRGGMSSHGGILGVLVAFYVWSRKHNVAVLHLTDMGCVASTAGLFFGRIANFINAELWGKQLPLQTSPPWWSVKYPGEITQSWVHNPEQYEEKLQSIEPLRSSIVGGNESFYTQVVSEAYSGNAEVITTIAPLLTAWYPSQLFQAISEGPLLLLSLAIVWVVPRKPGIISGWFLVMYGALRIVTEVFRQPDEGVSIIFGLSRGQLLSAAMVIAGGLIIVICTKQKQKMYGGILFSKEA